MKEIVKNNCFNNKRFVFTTLNIMKKNIFENLKGFEITSVSITRCTYL